MVITDVTAQIRDTARFDIRFMIGDVDCDTRTVCVQTQLRSSDGNEWNLAGQNYRIFYDGSKAQFITGSSESLLPAAQYSAVNVTQEIWPPVDITGQFGFVLPFGETLSFLNYSVDLMSLSNGGINLPASGAWVSTTQLCFEVTQEVLDGGSECLNIVWARETLTDEIATAFVEISEWVQASETVEALPNIYDDLGPEDGNNACVSSFCPGGADAETTALACSDGIDNDEDGLIDCADPNCAETDPCGGTTKTFDLALQLAPNGVDCITGQVCYDVNLTSAGSGFSLGSQNYRIFYNSDAGSFLSAQSLLGADFQAVSLQNGTPREGIDETGTGDLPYESSLGYVDFAVELNDSGTGSGVMISADVSTRVAQVCFTITDDVINNAGQCFEANWAEMGLTDAYEPLFIEIEEWLGPDDTRITTVNTFVNLSAASGDDSCFNVSCENTESGEVECDDNIDNDNDGLIDCRDPGCASAVICGGDECIPLAPTLSGN